MRVVHYYARYLAHPSGVTDSIDHWVDASEKEGVASEIWAARRRHDAPGNEFADAGRTSALPHVGRGRATWLPIGLGGKLKAGDVLVLHEGWVASNLLAAASAILRRVPYVVVPHGVYEFGIRAGMKDMLHLRARLEQVVLRHAAAVHVFYPGEELVLAAFEPRIRSFITIPNGAPEVDVAEEWRGRGDYFLWIGRFDPHHKGLDNLLRFWKKLSDPRPRLVLAGPDFLGGKHSMQQLIEQLQLGKSVEIRGRVAGKEKTELVMDARGYIHPSRWESCSITLLEMLAAGTPSLISASIHAAMELKPLGVLRSTDFERSHGDGDKVLASIDRNSELSAASRKWAKTTGSWSIVGRRYVELMREIAMSEVSR